MENSLIEKAKLSYWNHQLQKLPYNVKIKRNELYTKWDKFSISLNSNMQKKAKILTKDIDMAKYIFALTGFTAYISLYSEYNEENSVVMVNDEAKKYLLPLIINFDRSLTPRTAMNAIKGKYKEILNYGTAYVPTLVKNMENGTKFLESIYKYVFCSNFDQIETENTCFRFILDSTDFVYHCYYDCNYFSDTEINQLKHGLENVFSFMLEKTDETFLKFDYMSKEYKQMLFKFGSNKMNLEESLLTIAEKYLDQVEKSATYIALKDDNSAITYMQFNDRVVQILSYLKKIGVNKGDKVIISMEKSIDMIATIFAVILRGATYIPVSYENPVQWVNNIISYSNAKYILTQKKLYLINKEYVVPLVYICAVKDSSQTIDINELICKVSPDDIAYIIFTSGSSGIPKGVQVSHRNLVSMICGYSEVHFKEYHETERINIAVVAPVFFDVSVLQIFPCLLYGHTLFLLSDDTKADYDKMAYFFENNKINLTDFTPALFQNFVDSPAFTNYKYFFNEIILAGENLKKAVVHKFLENISPAPKLTNSYGPTECTVYASSFSVLDLEAIKTEGIPIGRPYPNVNLYVLNDNLNLQFIGIPGELYIGGAGVSCGYINNQEQNFKNFIENPILPNDIIYKTGDVVLWQEDGTLLFLDRIDTCIKLRGYRIELSEIESVLLEKQGIKQAIVRLIQNFENPYLVAYYTTTKSEVHNDIKEYLQKRLPSYMIPSTFIHMSDFPLSSNGKISEELLPDPVDAFEEDDINLSKEEKEIQEIFKEILNISRIGKNVSFFSIGGNSLSAIKLLNNINRRYNTVLKLADLYEASTIKEIASAVCRGNKEDFAVIYVNDEEEKLVPQSFQQQRIYVSEIMQGKSTQNNITEIYEIHGNFNPQHAAEVFRKLIERHGILRTSFYNVGDRLFQREDANINNCINIYDYKNVSMYDDIALEETIQKINTPFLLSEAPLLRINIYIFSNERYLIIINLHHIIVDAMSINILIRDFMILYKGNALSMLKSNYQTYSIHQHRFINSQSYEEMKQFWLNRLKDKIEPLSLPIDYDYPDYRSFEGGSVCEWVDIKQIKNLPDLLKEEKSSLFIYMFSCYITTLYKATHNNNIIVGTLMADRFSEELEDVMGVFFNVVPVLVELEGLDTLNQIRRAARDAIILSMKNMQFSYLDVISSLNISRNSKRNPVFDVSFNIVEYPSLNEHLGQEIEFYQRSRQVHETVSDLHMQVSNYGNRVLVQIYYNKKIFKNETIQKILSDYMEIFNGVDDESIWRAINDNAKRNT